jgi:hypothetical protein
LASIPATAILEPFLAETTPPFLIMLIYSGILCIDFPDYLVLGIL